VAELKATIDAVPCDAVLIATPIDLGRIIKIGKPRRARCTSWPSTIARSCPGITRALTRR